MFSVRPLSPFTLNPASCWVIRLNSMFLTVWPQEVLSFVTAGGGECARRKWVAGGWKSGALKGWEKEEAEWRRWKEEKQRMSNILASHSLTTSGGFYIILSEAFQINSLDYSLKRGLGLSTFNDKCRGNDVRQTLNLHNKDSLSKFWDWQK